MIGRMHRLGGLAVASLLGLGVTASVAAPPVRSTAPVDAWVTDGDVTAIASTSNGLYVGGDFTLIGRPTGAWVDIGPTGELGRIPAVVSDSVSDAVADGSGGWFLKGEITSVGGVAKSGITHLRADGKLDPGWQLRVKGATSALARSGTTLYLGGSFSKVDGLARTNLAAVDVRIGKVLPRNPSATAKKRSGEAWVDDVAIGPHGDTLYIAGLFQRIAGKPRTNVAAVTTAGKAAQWSPRVNGEVSILDPTHSAKPSIWPARSTTWRRGPRRARVRRHRQGLRHALGPGLRRRRFSDRGRAQGIACLRRRGVRLTRRQVAPRTRRRRRQGRDRDAVGSRRRRRGARSVAGLSPAHDLLRRRVRLCRRPGPLEPRRGGYRHGPRELLEPACGRRGRRAHGGRPRGDRRGRWVRLGRRGRKNRIGAAVSRRRHRR